MRILWILPYSPWPTSSGGKTRQYQLIRSLAQAGHRITLLVQSKTPLGDQEREALSPWLERLVVLPRRPLRSPVTLLAALFAPYPLLVSINGLAPRLQAVFSDLLQERWDVIQIEHSYSFQPYERLLRQSGQPFILTEHNVESELGAATYDRFPSWLRWFVRLDQWRYRRWERRVLAQAQQVVSVTEADAQVLSALSRQPSQVVVNGVDCSHYASVSPDYHARRLLFIGNYEYPPNVDAVEWALDAVMPLLWQQCPDVRFVIAGFAMPAHWSERWNDPRIEWHGFVPDLRELQRSASIFFAPLRQGGGSKLKVLEAMAAALPVVTTAQGVSGLAVSDGVHYRRGEDPHGLSAALVSLLHAPSEAQAVGEAGRGYVVAEHDWSKAARQLEQVYTTIKQEKDGIAACV
ncbi:group 1 glycosyl transferase [Ectopseudomonas mendocina DLHK]|nr:group 1 glycosyl transferase [Pseudomonas mendocina DLHK]